MAGTMKVLRLVYVSIVALSTMLIFNNANVVKAATVNIESNTIIKDNYQINYNPWDMTVQSDGTYEVPVDLIKLGDRTQLNAKDTIESVLFKYDSRTNKFYNYGTEITDSERISIFSRFNERLMNSKSYYDTVVNEKHFSKDGFWQKGKSAVRIAG